MKKLLTVFTLLLTVCAANAQQVHQSGNVTPGHVTSWTTNGVIQDGGTAANGALTSLGVTASGPGICLNSAPPTSPYNQICLTATATGLGITGSNVNGASGTITIQQNGTPIPFGITPFTAPASQWINAISSTGVPSSTQPAASDISGLGSMATQSANAVAITGGTITGMPTPQVQSDVATKAYVDINASGFHIHNPVVLATTAPLPAYNWTSTGGGTLTAQSVGALSIDGVAVTGGIGQRVLVKSELNSGTACNGNVNAACDGIYTVTTAGGASANYVLVRSSATDSTGDAENTAAGWQGGDTIAVNSGSINAGTIWANTTKILTLNTTAFSFFQFSSGISQPWQISGSNIFFTAGNVGIGIASPTHNLDVTGTINGTGAATFGSTLGVTGTATAGAFTTAGTATAGNFSTAGALTATGTVTAGALTTSGTTSTGALNASGLIQSTATGNSLLDVASNTGGTNYWQIGNNGTSTNGATIAQFLTTLSCANCYAEMRVQGGTNPIAFLDTGAGMTGGFAIGSGAGLALNPATNVTINGTAPRISGLVSCGTIQTDGSGNTSCGTASGIGFAIDATKAPYNVKCDGATNDTTAISNALAAAAASTNTKTVILPSGTCIVSSGILVMNSTGLSLIGQGISSTILSTPNSTGDIITMGSTANICSSTVPFGMRLSGLTIQASVSRTAGAGIHKYATQRAFIDHVRVFNMFDGLILSGECTAGTPNGDYDTYVGNSYFQNNSDRGITIGSTTCTNTAKVPANIFLNTLDVSSNGVGEYVICVGGLNQHSVQGITNTVGADYKPLSGQTVNWVFSVNEQWDTSNLAGLLIEPQAGGTVSGLVYSNFWGASTTSGAGLNINPNGASALVRGASFSTCVLVNNSSHGAFVTTTSGGATDHIAFNGCIVSMNSAGSTNVNSGYLIGGTSVSAISIHGGYAGVGVFINAGANPQKYGIDISAGVAGMQIVGVNTGGNNTAGTGCPSFNGVGGALTASPAGINCGAQSYTILNE